MSKHPQPDLHPVTRTLTQLTLTQLTLTQLTRTQLTRTQLTRTQRTLTQLTRTQFTITQLTLTQLTLTQLTITQLTLTQLTRTQLTHTLTHTHTLAGAITELVGPPGLGKTQMCMQAALLAAMTPNDAGEYGSVLYFDTENKFSAQRLQQMALARFPATFGPNPNPHPNPHPHPHPHPHPNPHPNDDDRGRKRGGASTTNKPRSIFGTQGGSSSHSSLDEVCDRVLVAVVLGATDLLDRIRGLESSVIDYRVRLIIVDSAAAGVRADFGPENLAARQALLGEQAAILKAIAERFQLPVLVTNQVR